jgi:hypothetical protein
MQLLVQVVCKPGRSVRDVIAKHRKIEDYRLVVSQQKNPERPNGWTKVHSTRPDAHGAINIQWQSNCNLLLARVVTRARGNPSLITADFIEFLLARLGRRVDSVNIIPRG